MEYMPQDIDRMKHDNVLASKAKISQNLIAKKEWIKNHIKINIK